MSSPTVSSAMNFDQLSPGQQERLMAALDQYMGDLSADRACDIDRFAAEYPDIAGPLKGYLASLNLLHEAGAGLGNRERDTDVEPKSNKKQLGDFVISREIGRGGMGVVYEATQISLDRRVALKVLPFAAALDRKQIARFEREAQAAAQLHHPNIVPVYSVGCDRGVHFYSMQYIEGQPLERAIDELRESSGIPGYATTEPRSVEGASNTTAIVKQPLSTCKAFSTVHSIKSKSYLGSVARLGVQAANALEHAHQFGVIHRDIKPSNLLIDRSGTLWVTDFGLARFQAGGTVTTSGDVMGTVRYMSPEQASGKTNFVDERSDVYSLGITLYELLTLQCAFDADNHHQILQKIQRDEPTTPRKINPAIPVDLETIVLKAISKSREQRYASASELVDDLNRFLVGEPTRARRPTLIDRAAKWSARHRSIVASMAMLLVMALIGTSVAAILIAHEKSATEQALVDARVNANRANERFRKAREILQRLAEHAQHLDGIPGAESRRGEMLKDTLGYYQGFVKESRGDQALQSDLALTYFNAANLVEEIGSAEEAIAGYREAQAIFTQLGKQEPTAPGHKNRLALCHNNIGLLLSRLRKPREARHEYNLAIKIQQKLVAQPYRNEPKHENDLALFYSNLALLERKHNPEVSEQVFQQAIKIQQKLVKHYPECGEFKHELALSYNNLAYHLSANDADRAKQFFEDAIRIQEQLVRDHRHELKYQSNLALSHNNLSSLLVRLGQLDDAKSACRRAIKIQVMLQQMAPTVTQHRLDLSISANNLGLMCSKAKDDDEAEGAYRLSRAMMSHLVEDFPNDLRYRSILGGVVNNLGVIHQRRDDWDEALECFQEAIAHQQVVLKAAPHEMKFRNFLSENYTNCGRALRALGRPADAAEIALLRRTLWTKQPEKLYQVAAELALAVQQLNDEEDNESAEAAERYTEATISTLRDAIQHGFKQIEAANQSGVFDSIKQHPQFRELLASQSEG